MSDTSQSIAFFHKTLGSSFLCKFQPQLFVCKYNWPNCVVFPRSAGISPEILLSNWLRSSNLSSLPIPTGISPVIEFMEITNHGRPIKFLIPSGMDPDIWFAPTISCWRVVEKLAIKVGNSPLNLLRPMSSSWRLLQLVKEVKKLNLAAVRPEKLANRTEHLHVPNVEIILPFYAVEADIVRITGMFSHLI